MNYIDKESALLLSKEHSFFAVAAPESLEDKYFDVAEKIRELHAELPSGFDLPDHLSEDQIEQIANAYARFVESISGDIEAEKKKVKALQLENGRLRARLRKAEGGDE